MFDHEGEKIADIERLIPPRTYIKGGKTKEQRFNRKKDIPNVLGFMPMSESTWAEALSDKSLPKIHAESDWKGAVLAQLGYAAITTGSVRGHRNRRTGTAVPLDCVDWTGQSIRLLFDNDVWFNTDVQDALFDLGQEYLNRGVTDLKVLLLPYPKYNQRTAKPIKMGIDDWAAKKGEDFADFVEKLMADARDFSDPIFAKMGKHNRPPTPNPVAALTFAKRPRTVLTKTPPERKYVIAPWIPERQFAALAMAGGGGKGYLGLSMAIHVALGKPWMGMPVKQGRVVIVAFEDPMEELDRRLHDVTRQYCEQRRLIGSARNEVIDTVLENVRYESADGLTLNFITQRQGEIFRTPELAALADKIKPINPIMTIVDPMSQTHSLNPNANEVGSALVRACGFLRIYTDSALLAMAHVLKAANKNSDRTELALLGAYAVSNGARSVILGDVLDPKEASETFVIEPTAAIDKFAVFNHPKGNYGAKAPPLYLMRGMHGVWQHVNELEYPRRKSTDEKEQWFIDLRNWLKKIDRKVFSKTEVTVTRRAEIGKTNEPKAEEYFNDAIEDGAFYELTENERATLPADQRKGGGERYCFSSDRN